MAIGELARHMAMAVLEGDEAAALALADLLVEERQQGRDPDGVNNYGQWLGRIKGWSGAVAADHLLLDCLRRCDLDDARVAAADAHNVAGLVDSPRTHTTHRHLTALWILSLHRSSVDICQDLAKWGAGSLEAAAVRGRQWWSFRVSSAGVRELETALLDRGISWGKEAK